MPSTPPVASPSPPAVPLTFAQMRARLVSLSREDSWGECARLLAAMKRAAHTDEELAIVHRDLGDFARAQGQLDEAAEAYDTAVAYARQVRQARANDASTDLLAGALSGVGDVAEAEGRLDAALSAFEEALALRRSRGGREANDPSAQRALSVNLERLADLREDRGHRMRALDLYRESYDIAGRLAAADPARFGSDLEATRARLNELEARIST
jgi:tetratricopeptide (TPR) repeat protein